MTQQLHEDTRRAKQTINPNRVYRKLQCGDNRSVVLSIPSTWAKEWDGSKLCGYVRMTRNPDSGILLEGV